MYTHNTTNLNTHYHKSHYSIQQISIPNTKYPLQQISIPNTTSLNTQYKNTQYQNTNPQKPNTFRGQSSLHPSKLNVVFLPDNR